jgi:hypothetical protein
MWVLFVDWITSIWKWAQPGLTVEFFAMLGEWGIVFAIIVEGKAAFKQYRSSRIIETIRYLEDDQTREDRRKIYRALHQPRIDRTNDSWWRDDELEAAAANVCARYGLIGAITQDDKNIRQFIAGAWSTNIITSYETLAGYIDYREQRTPGAFRHFKRLYKEAKRLKPE